MTNEEFKQIFDEGHRPTIKLAIEELNKTLTLGEISVLAGKSANQFRNFASRIGVKVNKKLASAKKTKYLSIKTGVA